MCSWALKSGWTDTNRKLRLRLRYGYNMDIDLHGDGKRNLPENVIRSVWVITLQ